MKYNLHTQHLDKMQPVCFLYY